MKQLKKRFRILAVLMVGLLVLSGLYGVYSVNAYSSRWIYSSRNSRVRLAKNNVIPGNIYDCNGIVIASSDSDGNRVYQENALARSSVVHLIGDMEGRASNGVESFQAQYLLGFHSGLEDRIRALMNGEQLRGDNVTITADSILNTYIVDTFRANASTSGKCGAVVVVNYKTGEIKALVSLPVYDPENITQEVIQSKQSPFWNRALQSTIPPGSTFKIITAAAALKYLPDAETRLFDCTGKMEFGARSVTDFGGEKHGEVTLAKAFRVSCNNTFAQVALAVGDQNLKQTAVDFGLNDNFLFDDIVVENSSYPEKDRSEVEIAWSGAGQSRITVSPMHMCMVAASVANHGIMMQPRLINKIVSPGGIIRKIGKDSVYRQTCSSAIAEKLETYMLDVVSKGTGTKAKVNGVRIAGKTGSAESTSNGKEVTHAWFTGYIAEDSCPYAVCVFVEEGGTGGSVAAPIAQKVFEYLSNNCRQ